MGSVRPERFDRDSHAVPRENVVTIVHAGENSSIDDAVSRLLIEDILARPLFARLATGSNQGLANPPSGLPGTRRRSGSAEVIRRTGTTLISSNVDTDRIDDAVLALLYLTRCDNEHRIAS